MLVCVFFCAHWHTRPRVQRAPGLPCALLVFGGPQNMQSSGKSCREIANVRSIVEVIFSRHRPRRRTIQYSRDSRDGIEKPRRTGSPAFAWDDDYQLTYGGSKNTEAPHLDPTPRQHAPAEQRRVRRRREIGRPAGYFFQRIGVHDDAAPGAFDALQRLRASPSSDPTAAGDCPARARHRDRR